MVKVVVLERELLFLWWLYILLGELAFVVDVCEIIIRAILESLHVSSIFKDIRNVVELEFGIFFFNRAK